MLGGSLFWIVGFFYFVFGIGLSCFECCINCFFVGKGSGELLVDCCIDVLEFRDGDELDVYIRYWFDCWMGWVSGID